MDFVVSIVVMVFLVVVAVAAWMYVLRDNKRRKAEADAAWRKEQSRQKRSKSAKAAALRKSDPDLAAAVEKRERDEMNAVLNTGMGYSGQGLQAQSQQDSRTGATGYGLYGRGDL